MSLPYESHKQMMQLAWTMAMGRILRQKTGLPVFCTKTPTSGTASMTHTHTHVDGREGHAMITYLPLTGRATWATWATCRCQGVSDRSVTGRTFFGCNHATCNTLKMQVSHGVGPGTMRPGILRDSDMLHMLPGRYRFTRCHIWYLSLIVVSPSMAVMPLFDHCRIRV